MFSILVVDDSPTICKAVESLLQNYGYDVTTVQDGLSAVNHLKYERPDLILLDVRMPHIDGIRLCCMLRSKSQFHGIPIIMLSAAGDKEHISYAMASGADDYLVKPVGDEHLLSVIGYHLGQFVAQLS